MLGVAKKFYSWSSRKANSRFAPIWLGFIFLSELILFLPMDAIVLLFCLENSLRRYFYAFMAALASTLTGIIGYYFGHFMWDFMQPYVLDHLISTSFFNRLTMHYQTVQNWAVFLGAFLPVPYKAITLSAGVCHLAFAPFVGAILIARWLRFFLIAKATEKWGVQIKAFIERHFHRFIIAIGLKIAFILSFFWALS